MIFVFVFSILDSFRRYFLSGYLIHMSFAVSILCAAVVFLAGITMGLTNTVRVRSVQLEQKTTQLHSCIKTRKLFSISCDFIIQLQYSTALKYRTHTLHDTFRICVGSLCGIIKTWLKVCIDFLQAYCQAVSGLLLYFFTASFSWLFCEVLLLVCFGPISRNWCLVILLFLTGWGKIVLAMLNHLLNYLCYDVHFLRSSSHIYCSYCRIVAWEFWINYSVSWLMCAMKCIFPKDIAVNGCTSASSLIGSCFY